MTVEERCGPRPFIMTIRSTVDNNLAGGADEWSGCRFERQNKSTHFPIESRETGQRGEEV